MKKILKNIFGFIIIGMVIYFWMVFLIVFGILLVIGALIAGILYKLISHISKYHSFDKAKKNKPKWFIFGDKLYIWIIDYLYKLAKEKNSNSTKEDIEEAMMFLGLGFYDLKDISKSEIKRKWKDAQRLYHPDSGSVPDIDKSQLANKYKDLLLNEIERNL